MEYYFNKVDFAVLSNLLNSADSAVENHTIKHVCFVRKHIKCYARLTSAPLTIPLLWIGLHF